jgi:hypothetical protein
MATTAVRRARAPILTTLPLAAVLKVAPVLLAMLTRMLLGAPHRKAIRPLDQPLQQELHRGDDKPAVGDF